MVAALKAKQCYVGFIKWLTQRNTLRDRYGIYRAVNVLIKASGELLHRSSVFFFFQRRGTVFSERLSLLDQPCLFHPMLTACMARRAPLGVTVLKSLRFVYGVFSGTLNPFIGAVY